jgi:hypothetical protein
MRVGAFVIRDARDPYNYDLAVVEGNMSDLQSSGDSNPQERFGGEGENPSWKDKSRATILLGQE